MNKNKKIFVKLRGGLGNQIFQYAFAIDLKNKLGLDYILIDTSYFNQKHIRGLELNNLSINNGCFTSKGNIIFNISYFSFLLFDRMFKHRHIINYPINIFSTGYYFCDKSIEATKLKNIKNAFVAGYFQQETIIRDNITELQACLYPKNGLGISASAFLDLIRSSSSIAISIRAGEDYYKFGWPVCSKNYYQEGLNVLLQKHQNSNVFIFSDAISKVKEEKWFDAWNVIYIENCSITESLYLLSQCDNYVIANSTFSWIGAYLSQNSKRDIIAPKLFYAGHNMMDGDLHITNCIYLDNQTGELI